MKQTIIELGRKVKDKQITWQMAADEFNAKFGENISKEGIRKR